MPLRQTGLDGGAGSAVVVAEDFCPLQKVTALDQRLELFHLDEVVVHPCSSPGRVARWCGETDSCILPAALCWVSKALSRLDFTGPARGRDDIESALLRHVCTFKR